MPVRRESWSPLGDVKGPDCLWSVLRATVPAASIKEAPAGFSGKSKARRIGGLFAEIW
jgi:hypothetical protein